MKGIILAGGKGTRLYPLTLGFSKQLLSVYNKPMIYYPLSMLMLAGIREILLISTPRDLPLFEQLLGDGSQLGLDIVYRTQEEPRGIADALLIGEDFVDQQPVCLILGDNIFYGTSLPKRLVEAAALTDGALVFAYQVQEPQHYAVITFETQESGHHLASSIEEKPQRPRSKYAVPGMYFYDDEAVRYVKSLQPSPRGELEITDLNKMYLQNNNLYVQVLGRGIAWLDAGTHETLLQASNFIHTIEERQGLMISCPEEIAYRKGFISTEELTELALAMNSNRYGQYLLKLAGQ